MGALRDLDRADLSATGDWTGWPAEPDQRTRWEAFIRRCSAPAHHDVAAHLRRERRTRIVSTLVKIVSPFALIGLLMGVGYLLRGVDWQGFTMALYHALIGLSAGIIIVGLAAAGVRLAKWILCKDEVLR